RHDEMLRRERLNVVPPPVARPDEAVNEDDRRSGAGTRDPEGVRTEGDPLGLQGGPQRRSRPSSTIRQRSWTTLMPASARRCAASSLRMPSWNQTLFGFAASMSSTWGGMSL